MPHYARFCPRTAAEVLALDVLHRSGGQPVTQDMVARWFDYRALHGRCRCWRREAAAQVSPDKVWRCLRAWRRTTTAPIAGIDPRRPLPERARALRATGLTMQAIAAELHCAPSTVHRFVQQRRGATGRRLRPRGWRAETQCPSWLASLPKPGAAVRGGGGPLRRTAAAAAGIRSAAAGTVRS